MKNRIISLLLFLALFIGLMPVGMLTASAASVGVITNVTYEYTDDLTAIMVTFDGYPGVSRYEWDYSLYWKYGSYQMEKASYTVSSESENNGRIWFVLTGTSGVWLANNGYVSYVTIRGYNKYGEKICESPMTVVLFHYNTAETSKTPLPAPGEPYFFGDGMIGFDFVDGAAYYEVSLSYNNRTLAKKTVTKSYADFSDYLEENMLSKYTVEVTAYPSDPDFSTSSSSTSLVYAKSDKLIGGAHITKDKGIVFSGQLDYLADHSVSINGFWQAYVNGEWQDIDVVEKDNYDYSMLRMKLMPLSMPGTVVTESLVGTNPNCPLIITDSEQFFDYEMYDKRGLTTYVKLGADITRKSGASFGEEGIELSDGILDIDLAGYTITYTNDTHGHSLFSAFETGRIIIRDSRRYDNKTGHWRDGEIKFNDSDDQRATSVLKGNITLESGRITVLGDTYANGYSGGTLIMNGGSITAKEPVVIEYGFPDEQENNFQRWKYGIFGGEFITTDIYPAITVNVDTEPEYYDYWKGIFTIANCRFYDGTNKSWMARTFFFSFPSEVKPGEISDAAKTALNFFPETATQSGGDITTKKFTEDDFLYQPWGNHDMLSGPRYTNGYAISSPTEITLDDLDFHIYWPKPGEKPWYLVAGEESPYFTYSLSWRKQIATNVYKDMLPTDKFESGRTYEAVITLHPRGRFSFNRNDTTQKTTVNGEEAFWNYSNNTFTLRLLPKDNYYNIWIGDVRVSETNKNDVLGDGTVQFVKKGDFKPASDTEMSGEYLDTLILDNFTMPANCYVTGHPNQAQIYIGKDVYILLRGNNTLDSGSVADGIYSDGRQMLFYGSGSLNIDVQNHDMTAINCPGSQISLYENVKLNVKGARGIYNPWDGDGENGVYVSDNASLSCYACQTEDGHDYPALTGSWVDIYDNGQLTCETQYDGEAIYAWGEDYPNSYYDIKVLKQGEYVNYGNTPYTPANGVNVDGGVRETECRYISIKPRSSQPFMKGDFDKDGQITVADALAALRIAAKLVAEDSTAIAIGDIDADNHVTVADALAILRVAAKLTEHL